MRFYSCILVTILLLTGVLINFKKVNSIHERQYPINCERQQLLVKHSNANCDNGDGQSDTRGCPRRES